MNETTPAAPPTTPVSAPATPTVQTRVVEPAVLMADIGDRAAVIACARPGVGLVPSDRCAGIVRGDRTSATGQNERLHIGRETTWPACDSAEENPSPGGFAFALDHGANGRGFERRSRLPFDPSDFQRRARGDGLGALIVWPASRGTDYRALTPSTRRQSDVDMAKAIALLAPDGIAENAEYPEEGVAERPPRVVARWDEDIDGDGAIDVLFNIDTAPHMMLAPRGIVGVLSSRGPDLVVIAETYVKWTPMGLIDLDRDGRPELLGVFQGPESTGVELLSFTGTKWERLSAFICGA